MRTEAATGALRADGQPGRPRDSEPAASELAHRIWAALERGANDLETLATDLGAEAAALSVALLELELPGLIEKLPGPRYARVRARIKR